MSNNYQDMSLFDFIVLCIKKLRALFVWLFRVIHHAVCVAWKYWYVMVICVILGIAFAWYWAKPEHSRFTGEATVTFPRGMKPAMESGIEAFFCEPPEAVGLTWKEVKSLRRFRYFNNIDAESDATVDFIDRNGEVDAVDSTTDVVPDRITIQLEMRGSSNYYAYECALKNYFNQREEYREPARRWRESMKRKIDYINKEIARTDSFIEFDYFQNNHTLRLQEGVMLKSGAEMHYVDARKLVEEREWLTEKLASTPDVINFETHFHAYTMLIYMKYIYSVIVSFFFGLMLAYMIEYRKEIYDFLQLKR